MVSFRPGTELPRTKVALVLNAGGIGDYINWTTAIRYVISTYEHTFGYIVTPPQFSDLAHFWFDSFSPRFAVLDVTTNDYMSVPEIQDAAVICPNGKQFANATGFPLLDLGFIYFNQHHKVPEGWRHLPEVRGDEVSLEKFNLPANYAVITTNATADNRRCPSETINRLIEHLVSRGVTPILLGKREIAGGHVGIPSDGINTDETLDLREMTSLTEAACIMARARLTFGYDNGLLHLASCSRAPVIWVFTSVDPALRVVPRPAMTAVISPPDWLACRFCNSTMRYIIGHDFKDCLHKNNLCVTSITPDVIIGAMDKILDQPPEEMRSW